jgi:quercetin dioxygenase-like cupin family protein
VRTCANQPRNENLDNLNMTHRQSLFRLALLLPLFASPCIARSGETVAPSLNQSATNATNEGIQPAISAHTAALPNLYELDAQPVEQINPLIQRQVLHGTQSTFVKWTVRKGGVFPLHHHANEQITWITKGKCEVSSQGKKFVVAAGDVMIIPPNVPHEFRCTEDTIDIDFFAPQRQDWIDGKPSVAAAAVQ